MKYRGSRDGFLAKDFHERCDGISPTVVLYLTKKGISIAGFTSLKWNSDNDDLLFDNDETAMIFNLTAKLVFPVKDHEFAMCNSKHIGPSFGNFDILVYSPFNNKGYCKASVQRRSFMIATEQDEVNPLTGDRIIFIKECDILGHFSNSTLNDIEVWQIIYCD